MKWKYEIILIVSAFFLLFLFQGCYTTFSSTRGVDYGTAGAADETYEEYVYEEYDAPADTVIEEEIGLRADRIIIKKYYVYPRHVFYYHEPFVDVVYYDPFCYDDYFAINIIIGDPYWYVPPPPPMFVIGWYPGYWPIYYPIYYPPVISPVWPIWGPPVYWDPVPVYADGGHEYGKRDWDRRQPSSRPPARRSPSGDRTDDGQYRRPTLVGERKPLKTDGHEVIKERENRERKRLPVVEKGRLQDNRRSDRIVKERKVISSRQTSTKERTIRSDKSSRTLTNRTRDIKREEDRKRSVIPNVHEDFGRNKNGDTKKWTLPKNRINSDVSLRSQKSASRTERTTVNWRSKTTSKSEFKSSRSSSSTKKSSYRSSPSVSSRSKSTAKSSSRRSSGTSSRKGRR